MSCALALGIGDASRKRRARVFAARRGSAVLGWCGAGVSFFPHRKVSSAGRGRAARREYSSTCNSISSPHFCLAILQPSEVYCNASLSLVIRCCG